MLTLQMVRQAVRSELERLDKEQAVDPEFADLCRVETGDSGSPEEIDIAHPRPMFCQDDRQSLNELFKLLGSRCRDDVPAAGGMPNIGWDEAVTLSKAAPSLSDGTVVEQHGAQTWRYHYAKGRLTRMELEDPELGKMFFDGAGNEI